MSGKRRKAIISGVTRDFEKSRTSVRVGEKAQRIIASRDKSASFRHKLLGRGRTSTFLLAGLVTCKLCGSRFNGWSQRLRSQKHLPPDQRYQAYLCGGYINKGTAVCKRHPIEKGPFEEFIIGKVHERMMQILDEWGRKLLRAYVKEELLKARGRPEQELREVEKEMAALKAEADRLLANLTEANKEFIDERLIDIKERRRELEAARRPSGPRHGAVRTSTRPWTRLWATSADSATWWHRGRSSSRRSSSAPS